MRTQPTHTDLAHRLRSAEGHLRSIRGMLEADADCRELLLQVRAVQGALREVNRLLIHHYLTNCLQAALEDPDQEVCARALATVVELYRLCDGAAAVTGKEHV